MTMRRLLLPLLLLTAATGPVANSHAQSVSFTVLRRLFPNTEGRLPYAPLVQGADGRFYGTASRGGPQDQGTIFRLDPDGGNFAVLYTFNGPPGDGARPEGGLVQARDGLFYGATLAGGFNDRGLLYRLGSDRFGLQPIAAFNLGFPGATPTAELVQGDDGNLYGTAEFGGVFNNFGTVFRVSLPDLGLNRFTEFAGSPDAANPAGRLLVRTPSFSNGTNGPAGFYGATLAGGFANLGTLFRVTPDGVRQLLYSFTGNNDGALPRPLTEGTSGFLFGVTRSGGPLNYGGVFRLDPSDGGFTVLYGFNPTNGTGYDAFSELLFASDGNLYGTTRRGGPFDAGTVYRVSQDGRYATIYAFTGTGVDGGYPQAALVQGSDGRIYGVATGQQGEAATVFRLDLGLARPRPTVRLLNPGAGKVGDTVALLGSNFVGATAVRFQARTADGVTGDATAPLTVVSARYATFTVPAGAATGPLAVLDADGHPGPFSAANFTVNPAPAPLGTAVVTLAATDPVAVRGDSAGPGRLRLTRADPDPRSSGTALTVRFKVQAASTARRDVDYQLVNRGTVLPAGGTDAITLPAGKFTTGLEVVPLSGGGAGTVKIKLAAPDPTAGYTLGDGTKGTVTIQ